MDVVKHHVHVLFDVNQRVGEAFYWLSIGLAVLTAFLQGLVTALAFMTESSNRWTFRFRLAMLEHSWWMIVSLLLLASLVMVTLSFTSGNGGDAISVLALSSATFLALVQYTLPAWQYRFYARTRWLAWTGPSRSTIKQKKQIFCGDARAWNRLVTAKAKQLAQLQPTPSDYYGWRLWPVRGIEHNPVDILTLVNPDEDGLVDTEDGKRPIGVYANAEPTADNASLLWGPDQGFRRVISRAVSSMPLGLLQTSPSTVDGYDGRGLTNAMGILGRNKGLQPWKLVFRFDSVISSHMETTSTWAPRPTKVLRSFYKNTLRAQYGGLGEDYVNSAVELALILSDTPYWAVDQWLLRGLEHQSLQKSKFLEETALATATFVERQEALDAHYQSCYVSMILSLNYMPIAMRRKRDARHVEIGRPDLLCLGALLKARGCTLPSWWKKREVRQKLQEELLLLPQDLDWKLAMARLVGLGQWPTGLEDSAW